ncbi:N-formylglutamate amidohydrolase [Roseibium salinum]|nr:N-formylglutamate amidohydrolase [Roseibium salinum]
MSRAVAVENAEGRSPFVFVCDHASNFFPPPYDQSLAITEADKSAHIAWDPGALGVAKGLSQSLDAPLVYTTVSRLIIDCNREESREDLIPCLSETTEIAGNRDLPASEKKRSGWTWCTGRSTKRSTSCSTSARKKGCRRLSCPSIPSRLSTRAGPGPGKSA